MTALPIVERELRVAARNRETYWGRSGVILGLGLLWIPGWMGTFGTTTEMNTFVFNGMLWVGFAVSCLACLFTADAISRERREGTLGLLFLSRVRVADLLLGKLGSSGLKCLCMLAAFLPMLMIPVLAGGVTGGEACREGLVLLNAFWFSLCAGLLASTLSKHAFTTIKYALATVVFVIFVPLVGEMGSLHTLVRPIPAFTYEMFSPLTTVFYGRENYYKIAPYLFWISLVSVQVLAWLLLLFTGLQLRRSLLEPEDQQLSGRVQGPLDGHRRRGLAFAEDRNPVDWLVQQQRGILTTLWIAAAIEILYFASSWAVFRGMFSLGWPAIISWVVWFVASASTDALFARAGSKFFYDSKRSGQLETLLTTPLGPRGVAEGQWSALKKLLAWPVAIALGVMLLDEDFSLAAQIGPGINSFGWVTQCLITWGIDISVSILGILAVCWFGMLFALKGKGAAGIMLRAAALGTGWPALFKTLFAYVAARVAFTVSSGGLWPDTISNWLEEIIIMMYYLWLFRWAKRAVLRELSGVAPVRQKSFRASPITHQFAPPVTRDVTA
jgi:ABC-type transport system involved in multi-copper enzyme maturation permease subunit